MVTTKIIINDNVSVKSGGAVGVALVVCSAATSVQHPRAQQESHNR